MNNEMALNQRTHSLKRSEKGRFLGTIQFSMKWKKKSSMVAFFKKKKTTPKRFQRLRTKDEVTWSCLTMNKIFSNWTQKTIYIYSSLRDTVSTCSNQHYEGIRVCLLCLRCFFFIVSYMLFKGYKKFQVLD